MLQQLPSLHANGIAPAPQPFPDSVYTPSVVSPSADTPRPIIWVGGLRSAYRNRTVHESAASATIERQIINPAIPPTQEVSALDDDSSASRRTVAAFLAFMLLALPWRDTPDPALPANEMENQRAFTGKLLRSLEVEPVEVGYSHPGMRIMEEAIATSGQVANRWIVSAYLSNYRTRPTIAADLLRCVSRLEHHNIQPWGILMAISALSHPDPELREAAVRAFEVWGGLDSVEVLRTRVNAEPLPWLADYMRQVIEDITG